MKKQLILHAQQKYLKLPRNILCRVWLVSTVPMSPDVICLTKYQHRLTQSSHSPQSSVQALCIMGFIETIENFAVN